ncbi:MAG: hypothetical protein L0H83_15890, partial [Salinisphaera sp.]|nr:hypothetical protein [Salinisphaera sp.]
MDATVRKLVGGLLLLSTAGSVQAQEANNGENTGFMETTGLFDVLGLDINKTSFMQDLGLTLSGWLEAGYTINIDDPRDDSNSPVAFN